MFFGYCYKNRTSCSKNCYQKASHKATEATGEFIGTKITNKIVKMLKKLCSTRKKRRDTEGIKTSIIKWYISK